MALFGIHNVVEFDAVLCSVTALERNTRHAGPLKTLFILHENVYLVSWTNFGCRCSLDTTLRQHKSHTPEFSGHGQILYIQ